MRPPAPPFRPLLRSPLPSYGRLRAVLAVISRSAWVVMERMHIAFSIRQPSEQAELSSSDCVVVTPGQIISKEGGFLRGHGTYVEDGHLIASVAGIVEKVNQLISVRPLKCRYIGEVGDIVVGRISSISNKMWKVDVNGHQEALLMLTSVNLPEGAQRRRTYEDQLQMREFFQENDLISAEVQDVKYDGTLSLHTRSLRYGKLENGQFLAVAPALVKRLKQHVVALEIGVDVILGNNGYLWITRSMNWEALADDNRASVWLEKRKAHAETPISREDRVKIAKVHRACVHLNDRFQLLCPESIMQLYHSYT